MTSPGGAAHAFLASDRERHDSLGRPYRLCAICGKSGRGRGHSAGLAVVRRRPPPPIRRAPLPAPREILALALALDAVLELDETVVGWRLVLRARDLRTLMPDIPRSASAPGAPTESEEIVPASSPSRARDGGAGARNDAPAPSRILELEPRPVRARARAQTKAIADPKFRELAARAIADGFGLRRTGSGHWTLERGPGERLTFAASPSDHRAYLNTRARARRLGIDTEGL